MFDFRLKVFHTVAKRMSFTRAAEELFITQPAVTRHIHEIEAYYKCKLFDRYGTKIRLTLAGQQLLKHTEAIFLIYRDIAFDLAAVNDDTRGVLRIGASTTAAQYVLPRYLASFRQKFPEVTIELTTGNTARIENLLTENKIGLGIVEGQSRRQHIKYTRLIKDEIVLCASKAKKQAITLNELKKLPLVLREPGSGSLEVVLAALKKAGIRSSQLNVDIILESSESIKSYLQSSGAFAFLSVHAILNELTSNALAIIDVKELAIERHFYLIAQKGDEHHLNELFLKHILYYNFRL